MINDLKYMISNWFKWQKKSFVYFFLKVPALILQPIIISYIPKVMIDCINENVTINRLFIIIVLLSILMALAAWLIPFMQELLIGSARIIRMRYAVLAFEKNLRADYKKIESMECRTKSKRAADFYNSNFSSSSEFIELLNQFVVCVLGVITSFFIICKVDFLMVLIILITCVIEFFLLKYLNKKEKTVKDSRSSIMVKFDYFYNISKDASAAKDIRIYDFSSYFISILSKCIYQIDNIVTKYMHQSINVTGTRSVLNFCREIIAYIYLIYLVCNNKLIVSDFIFYFGVITGFSNWLVNLVSCYSNIERCCNDCSEYRKYIEYCDSNRCIDNIIENELNIVNSIEFKNVSFLYDNNHTETIKDLNFYINAGENIAIVGSNGAGKTTLVKLLCGLYSPTKGKILINGNNISHMNKEIYMGLFAPVFQNYSFLPTTIAENICSSKEIDQKRLYESLESAGINHKIEQLNFKENEFLIKEVNKDAIDFSGGEKQKLLFAKAIYKNAQVLILDEPTAALDPIAENELYLKYSQLTKEKISFFVSHRLSSTRFCDKIFYLKDGQIIEIGTHNELMALHGEYYKMYNLQSVYYKEMDNKYG